MVGMGEVERPGFLRKWEEEIGNKISDKEARRVLSRVNDTSVNYKIAEMNFRILARMYFTPDLAHKIQDGTSQYCWRGCGEVGTMLHVWWTCPVMRKFWEEIRKFIYLITNQNVPDDPWVCLHHGSDVSSKCYRRTLLPHLLNAAKSLIPRHWRETRRPSLREWFDKTDEIYCMEYLRYSEGLEMEDYEEIWRDWVRFKTSDQLAEMREEDADNSL